MKNVVILGSTGSIGGNTLKVIDHLRGSFRVIGLAAGKNIATLAEQVATFKPAVVSVAQEQDIPRLHECLAATGSTHAPRVLAGLEGMIEVATHPEADTVVSAAVGAVGLLPTYEAIGRGKRVALANKETLVMAGALMTRRAKAAGAELLPIDSEHNALHQCLHGVESRHVQRLILTASGGPFRTAPVHRMAQATPDEALQHPTWRMGRKITIDSATLMNKGLEVIEAAWLFGVGPQQVDILIHPQSIVHSMVEMVDGSIIAQLGVTDMKFAIQYALTYPARQPTPLSPLSFSPSLGLEFHPPDFERFPCLTLAYRAATAGGTLPIVLNAANEVAVAAFLDCRIGFTDIPQVIETVMNNHELQPVDSIEQVLQVDRWARVRAHQLIEPRTPGHEQFR
jgi:1-deoxy-D-xylulose-5-phosphate reductoisomerase